MSHIALVLVAWLVLAWPAAAQDAAETARLHALFARQWAWVGETFPEWATFRGDHRFGDRLTDNSAAGRAATPWLASPRR